MSVIGSLAAFDHWRQRVYLIESVPVLGHRRRRARRRLRRGDRAASSGPSPTSPGRCRTCRSRRREAGEELPAVRSTMPQRHVPAGGRGRQGAHRRRRHLPGRAVAALRHRSRGRSVRLLPRAAPGQPEPVHVLPAPSRHHHRRQLARADGAGARTQGDQPADRRHAPPRPRRRGRSAHGRRAEGEPEGGRRAHHAGRPGPQRRRPGRQVRHACTSTS